MTSSDNLTSIDPWAFRSAFAADSWLSEAFGRDTDTLTKALQESLSGAPISKTLASPFISPETPTVSNVSGSDHEALPTNRQRNAVPVSNSGRVLKRKSRASKRTQTTFITADPANFRRMVQQVTGVRLGNSQAPIVKPEPQRPGTRFGGITGWLPTLDTSALLLDAHEQQQQVVMGPGSVGGSGPSFPFEASLVGMGGVDFETLPSFPTLESWKVLS